MQLPPRVGKTTRRIGWFRPLVPIGMLIIGYWLPIMRVPVTNHPTDDLWMAIVIEIVVAVAWIISEILTVADKDTAVTQLQWDNFVSMWVALPLAIVFGWQLAWHAVEWWFIVPFIATLIDATLSGYLGINNAAQKPIIHGPRE